MALKFNELEQKLIELDYIPIDSLDKKTYPWKDKFRVALTKELFEEENNFDLTEISIFVKVQKQINKYDLNRIETEIEMINFFVIGEPVCLVDTFMKDTVANEYRFRPDCETVLEMYDNYKKDLDQILKIAERINEENDNSGLIFA